MSRKHAEEEHENHERWLLSYADFITLLFALFTVLYVSARSDDAAIEALVRGMNAAFDGGMPSLIEADFAADPPDLPDLPPNPYSPEAAAPVLYALKDDLTGSLSDHVLQLGFVDQDLVLVLPERLLFAPGQAELHPAAYGALSQIARALAGSSAQVEITGHADTSPVAAGGRWPDNWALSSERALATARYLARHGVDARNLAATARVEAGEGAEARAVTIRLRVAGAGTAAEVSEKLRPG